MASGPDSSRGHHQRTDPAWLWPGIVALLVAAGILSGGDGLAARGKVAADASVCEGSFYPATGKEWEASVADPECQSKPADGPST